MKSLVRFVNESKETFVNEAFKSTILSSLMKNSDKAGKKIITDHAKWSKSQGAAISEIEDRTLEHQVFDDSNFMSYEVTADKGTETLWSVDGNVVAKTGKSIDGKVFIIDSTINGKSWSALVKSITKLGGKIKGYTYKLSDVSSRKQVESEKIKDRRVVYAPELKHRLMSYKRETAKNRLLIDYIKMALKNPKMLSAKISESSAPLGPDKFLTIYIEHSAFSQPLAIARFAYAYTGSRDRFLLGDWGEKTVTVYSNVYGNRTAEDEDAFFLTRYIDVKAMEERIRKATYEEFLTLDQLFKIVADEYLKANEESFKKKSSVEGSFSKEELVNGLSVNYDTENKFIDYTVSVFKITSKVEGVVGPIQIGAVREFWSNSTGKLSKAKSKVQLFSNKLIEDTLKTKFENYQLPYSTDVATIKELLKKELGL